MSRVRKIQEKRCIRNQGILPYPIDCDEESIAYILPYNKGRLDITSRMNEIIMDNSPEVSYNHENNIFHQLCISLQLNKINNIIPNYLYVYGGIDSIENSYVIYQSFNGKNLESVYKTLNNKKCLSCILQLVFASIYSWLKLGYVHDDFSNCILISDVSDSNPGNFYIKYPILGNYYVQSDSVVHIVNHQKALISKKQNFDDIRSFLYKLKGHYITDYCIKYFDENQKFNLEEFIKHLEQLPEFKQIVTKDYDNSFPLIDNLLLARPKKGLYNKDKISIRYMSYLDYYDVKGGSLSNLEVNILNIEIKERYTKLYVLTKSMTEKLYQITLDHYLPELIDKIPYEKLFTIENLYSFKDNLSALARVRYDIKILYDLYRVGVQSIKEKQDFLDIKELNEINKKIDFVFTNFSKDICDINEKLRDPEGHFIIHQNPIFKWYLTETDKYLK